MNLLIVDDEPLLGQRLERLCREVLGARIESLRVATRFAEASTWLHDSVIDLLLLDLNLKGQDGMELLAQSAARAFHTIVMSGSAEQAVRAFEYGVLDFVPKPFTRERLERALQRAVDQQGGTACAGRYLAVRKRGRIELVAIEDLLYVEGAGAYAELVLNDGRRELHDKTLEKLHALLPPVFERIHKSYVVRWTAVKALHAREGSHYEVELHSGLHLPVGRTRYKELRERLAAV